MLPNLRHASLRIWSTACLGWSMGESWVRTGNAGWLWCADDGPWATPQTQMGRAHFHCDEAARRQIDKAARQRGGGRARVRGGG